MKIAILTPTFYDAVKEIDGEDHIIYGGAERYLVELCHFLQQEGHYVHVYQAISDTCEKIVKEGDKEKKVVYKVRQIDKFFEGIPISCLPVPNSGWNMGTHSYLNLCFNETSLFFDLRIYFATYMCFPNVVHPCISISHGIYWDYSNHFIQNLNDIERKDFFRKHLYGFTAPDVCVAVDSNVRKVIAAISPGSESNIEIIYNFVNCKEFTPLPVDVKQTSAFTNLGVETLEYCLTTDADLPSIYPERITVLFPRRLTILRGYNEFALASTKLPDYNFIAVGQSHDVEVQNNFENWSKTRPNLKVIWKPMHEMVRVYQSADIAVIPTKATEGLSLSLLESMACGLPIITTPVGGLGDAVIPNYNALVFDPNHDDLTDYIRYLAENPDLRTLFGKRNREIAETCFDIEIWKERWRRVIRRFC